MRYSVVRFRALTKIAALVLFVTVMPVSGQIAVINKQALIAKGYTQGDFKAAEATQIGSNYPLFRKLSGCLQQAGDLIVRNNITDARATLLVSQCQDDALELRAGLARSLGLPQATRVVSMLSYDFGIQLRKRMQAGNSSGSGGVTRLGIWTIVRTSQTSCMAVVDQPSYVDEVRFLNSSGHIILLIKTDFDQPSVGSPTNDKVLIGHYPAPTVMDGQFKVTVLSGHTWLAAEISVQDLKYIQMGGTILIEESGSSRTESRDVGGSIIDVIDNIKRCS